MAAGSTGLELDFVVIDVQDEEASRAPPPSAGLDKQASDPPKSAESTMSPEKWVGVRSRDFEVRIDKQKTQSIGLDIDKADGKTMLIMATKTGPVSDFNAKTKGDKVKRGDRIITMNGVEGNVKDMLASLAECEQVVCKLRRVVEFRATIEKTAKTEKLGIDVDHGSNDFLSVISNGKLANGDSVLARTTHMLNTETPVQPGTPGVVMNVHPAKAKGNYVDVQFKDVQNLAVKVPTEWLLKQACSHGPVERYNEKVGPEGDVRVGDLILEVNGLCGAGGKVQDMLKKVSQDTTLTFLVRRAGEPGLVTEVDETYFQSRPPTEGPVTDELQGPPATTQLGTTLVDTTDAASEAQRSPGDAKHGGASQQERSSKADAADSQPVPAERQPGEQ